MISAIIQKYELEEDTSRSLIWVTLYIENIALHICLRTNKIAFNILINDPFNKY